MKSHQDDRELSLCCLTFATGWVPDDTVHSRLVFWAQRARKADATNRQTNILDLCGIVLDFGLLEIY